MVTDVLSDVFGIRFVDFLNEADGDPLGAAEGATTAGTGLDRALNDVVLVRRDTKRWLVAMIMAGCATIRADGVLLVGQLDRRRGLTALLTGGSMRVLWKCGIFDIFDLIFAPSEFSDGGVRFLRLAVLNSSRYAW